MSYEGRIDTACAIMYLYLGHCVYVLMPGVLFWKPVHFLVSHYPVEVVLSMAHFSDTRDDIYSSISIF